MISFAPLHEKVKEKGILWKDVQQGAGIGSNTIAKLNRHYPVSLDVIDKLCGFFECPVEEIIKYVPNKKAPGA